MAESPNLDVYSRALAEAKSELEAVVYEIGKLSKRQQQLEALIANLTPLLPQANPSLNFPPVKPTPPVVSEAQQSQPIWKSIVQAINGKAAEFTVRDAIEGLERIGRGVESPNRVQIIRNALVRKDDVFVQIAPGKFAVKGQEKEAPEETP